MNTDYPDWREIDEHESVSDTVDRVMEHWPSCGPIYLGRPHAGNRGLRTLSFDLALTEDDRAFLRERGVRA